MEKSTTGIILMNLGSPDSTRIKDVRKYLNEFLMDERVIDISYLGRLLLVKGIIVPFRAPKSAHAYSSIWTKDGSPLIVLTEQLKVALQQQVEDPVVIAMRYGYPSPKDAFDQLIKENPQLTNVILVPLYPHYAMSSYETAIEYAKMIHRQNEYRFKLTIIKPFFDDAYYLKALAESIRPYLNSDYDHILFSYHGVPERHIKKSDVTGGHCLSSGDCCNQSSPAHAFCYRHQCLKTTNSVATMLGIPKEKWSYSFQSRLGRDEWLKPYTAVRLQEMPKEGIKNLLIVCPAFISDCLETLEEIAVEGRNSFLEAGGETFINIPCLNVQPLWVKAIAKWIEEYKLGEAKMILT